MEKTIASFNRTHKERLHPKPNGYGLHIAYHYVIDGKGNIKATRPLDETGYHASNWLANLTSVGICLTGDFNSESPSSEQKDSLHNLILQLRKQFNISAENVKAHRDFTKTKNCPGNNLSDDMIRTMAQDDLPPPEFKDSWNIAIANKYVTKDPNSEINNHDMEEIFSRMGIVKKKGLPMSRARFIECLHRIKPL